MAFDTKDLEELLPKATLYPEEQIFLQQELVKSPELLKLLEKFSSSRLPSVVELPKALPTLYALFTFKKIHSPHAVFREPLAEVLQSHNLVKRVTQCSIQLNATKAFLTKNKRVPNYEADSLAAVQKWPWLHNKQVDTYCPAFKSEILRRFRAGQSWKQVMGNIEKLPNLGYNGTSVSIPRLKTSISGTPRICPADRLENFNLPTSTKQELAVAKKKVVYMALSSLTVKAGKNL